MILGIVGCDVRSQTVNAVAVMPGVVATSLNAGAVASDDMSVRPIA